MSSLMAIPLVVLGFIGLIAAGIFLIKWQTGLKDQAKAIKKDIKEDIASGGDRSL